MLTPSGYVPVGRATTDAFLPSVRVPQNSEEGMAARSGEAFRCSGQCRCTRWGPCR